MPETYTITNPKTGKPVTFDWDYDTPPSVEEQAAILEEAEGSADLASQGGGQAGAFTDRLIQNAAGIGGFVADMMPGGSKALMEARGEPTTWSDVIPGKQTVMGLAGNLADKWQAAGEETNPIAKAGRYAGLVPEAVGIPVTEMGEALGSGDYGKLGADAFTLGVGGVLGRGPKRTMADVKSWLPRSEPFPGAKPGAPPPPAMGGDFGSAMDHYLKQDSLTNPAVQNPGQLFVDAAKERGFPSRPPAPTPSPGALDVLRSPRSMNELLDSSLPIERPNSPFVTDTLDALGIPETRNPVDLDSAWTAHIDRQRPTPAISHVNPPRPSPISLDGLGVPENAGPAWAPDHLEQLGIPENRRVLEPDAAWMRALAKDLPHTGLERPPLTPMRPVLDDALRSGRHPLNRDSQDAAFDARPDLLERFNRQQERLGRRGPRTETSDALFDAMLRRVAEQNAQAGRMKPVASH